MSKHIEAPALHGVLSLAGHADVTQALHDPRLLLPGRTGADPSAHLAVRAAAGVALSAARLTSWHDAISRCFQLRLASLPAGIPVDLVTALAEPWALDVALLVTGAPPELAPAGAALARQLFLAAASVTDGDPTAASIDAAVGLARLFSTLATPASGYADVQTFVALSQTLPALMAGAWLVLLQHPAALAALIASPRNVPRSLGELLRLGSPAQAVFREASEDLTIGDLPLQRGDRVALLLAAANRDPRRYPEPNRLDLSRDASGHLGFGSGPHRCVGVSLVHLALGIATEGLLERTASLERVDEAASAQQWQGGFAMRAPASLWVVWRAGR
jgi:cytochrome P450